MATTTMYGADPAQLDQLGEALRHAAEQLDRIRGSLGGRLHHTSWCGSDASRARDEWDHRGTAVLLGVAGTLREQGHRLHSEAEQQRRASDVTGGGHQGPHHGGHGILDHLGKVWKDAAPWLKTASWMVKLGKYAVENPEKLHELGKKLLERFPAAKGTLGVLSKIGKGLGVVGIVDGLATGNWGKVAFGVISLGLKANPVGLVVSGLMVVDAFTGDHARDAVGGALRWTWDHGAPVIADAVTERFAGDLRAIGNGVNALGTGLSKAADAAHTAGAAINHAADRFSSMFGKD